MRPGVYALGLDFDIGSLVRWSGQPATGRVGRKKRRAGKRPSAQPPPPESIGDSTDSGRLQHREHQRSGEPDHEPRRGEVSPDQES